MDEEEPFILGWSHPCACQLEDAQVAGQHVSIRIKDGTIYMTDLDPTTGPLVTGQEITKVGLHRKSTSSLKR